MNIYFSDLFLQSVKELPEDLEESKTEEVVIRRRKGDTYVIVPQSLRPHHFPFDVPSLHKRITKEEIIEAIHESRERAEK